MKAGGSFFSAGRASVFARGGMVATSQPLAAQAGLWVLREGGNALEACLCAAATLNVVEPQSTGVGGDMFLLYWDEEKKKLLGLNASGRAPRRASAEALAERGLSDVPAEGILAVTAPGAVDGWWEAHGALASGRIPWARLFEPAIEYAEGGFPLSPIIANAWRNQEGKLGLSPASARTYLPAGRAPRAGEVFRNPGLARTLRLLAAGGREAFYEGPIAEAIVATSRELGGFLEMEDLRDTHATWAEPLSARYRGYEVHELPPNGQGLAALLCLNILEGFEVGQMEYGSPDHLHLLIEAMKLAFADRDRYIADPESAELPVKGLLDEAYTRSQRARLGRERAATHVQPGLPPGWGPQRAGALGGPGWGDTIYCCAADGRGNLCSFINSLFHHFGSGVTAGETGVVLQNRGTGFSLDPSHPNRLEGGKRPFHTIIPGFLTRDGKPVLSFGVMGGDMQPQGHVQLLSNMLDFGMDVQAAIDAPRFRILGGREVAIEQGVPDGVLAELSRRGHRVARAGGFEGFGGGQAIRRLESGAYVAGSDHRRDGCAVGF